MAYFTVCMGYGMTLKVQIRILDLKGFSSFLLLHAEEEFLQLLEWGGIFALLKEFVLIIENLNF